MNWRTWILAALLTLAMWLAVGGCTIICNSEITHVHNGDTSVQAEGKVATEIPISALPGT